MAKILVVEDDQELATLVEKWLRNEHHVVEVTFDGSDGLSRVRNYQYDLLVLDWNLPNVSGMDILKSYRSAGGAASVLFLTGNDKIDDVTAGLDSGADDYLKKPFHARELTARVKALLRRSQSSYTGSVLQVGNISLDAAQYRVTVDDAEVHLLPKEFALLEFLMRNQNRVFPQELLLERVWTNDSDATVNALQSCMKRLRKKIDCEGKPSLIKNIHGVGYKLSVD